MQRFDLDDLDTHVLDERYSLLVDTRNTRATRDGEWVITHISRQWWLLDNGAPIAFLSTLLNTGDETRHGGCPLVLCDIEVRPEHRGNGHTRRIVAAAETIEGHQMWTSGGFTPLGAAALSWLPVYPWETQPGVKYDDMPFVEDWDNLIPKNPL